MVKWQDGSRLTAASISVRPHIKPIKNQEDEILLQ